MHPNTEAAFERDSEFILAEAGRKYGVDPSGVKRLGSFESFVFEFGKGGQEYILRVTPGSHRPTAQIQGELEWVNYLAEGGVSVARAVQSPAGSLIEVVNLDGQAAADESFYTLVVFEKARGRRATKEDWNRQLFVNWGQTIGRMHALTKKFEPSDPAFRRPMWHDDVDLDAHKHLPASQEVVLDKFDRLMERLRSLPTEPDSFGLVHEDMHHSNFFVDKGRITVFDFDDCRYHWFADDLVIPLFYAVRDAELGEESAAYARHFMSSLLEGYTQENSPDPAWFELMPDFLKLRELVLYTILHIENAFDLNGWCRRFSDGRRERIENDVPVIDMDFSQFA